MTEDKYKEVRNVNSEMSQATEFLIQADEVEDNFVKSKSAQDLNHTMTSSYVITFDEYWFSKQPKHLQKDFSEQLIINMVQFDQGSSNIMWVEGNMLVRMRPPARYSRKLK